MSGGRERGQGSAYQVLAFWFQSTTALRLSFLFVYMLIAKCGTFRIVPRRPGPGLVVGMWASS
jgi:hypothetical protein